MNGGVHMVDIFICEDDQQQKEKITNYIKNYIMIEQLDMRITLSTVMSAGVFVLHIQNYQKIIAII
ncbi:MAG: hypothetical protein AB2374_14360 [Cytobacillus gottheilii]